MAEEGAPWVALPERMEPRRRFGPFPSAPDGLKFVLLAAMGALVALRFGLLWWTPFLGGGTLLGLYRPDGRALDERLGGFARWRLRSTRRSRRPGVRDPSSGDDPVARVGADGFAAALEAGGIPLAYLPAEDARRLFAAYRDLLREVGPSFALNVGRVPVRTHALLPPASVPEGRADRPASEGYRALLRLVTATRSVRRVTVVQFAPPGPDRREALERSVARWTAGLAGMGIPTRRLVGRAVERARTGGRAVPEA